ncbi:hypothetical protein [Streptomyces sp. NPDC008125]|uniref:hypothetical protein n=1 Tax=Streptomyces sp. NPDC008125 TaxID=3364811 RepID=UPI0036E95CF9
MDLHTATMWETAELAGGPADGLRMRVPDQPPVLQVTRPCRVESPDGDEFTVDALYVYRRDPYAQDEPVAYGFDPASP